MAVSGTMPAAGGSVSVTQLGATASRVLAAVRAGHTFPISRHGVIVAVLAPIASVAEAIELGLDPDAHAVSARELGHGNASAVVDRAARGESVMVTYRNRPIGALRPVSEWRAVVSEPLDLGAPVPDDSLAASERGSIGEDMNAEVEAATWTSRQQLASDYILGLSVDLPSGIVVTHVPDVDTSVVISEAGRATLRKGRVLRADFMDVNRDTENVPLPVPVRPGDTVVYAKHGGKEFDIKGEEYVVLGPEDVIAVVKTPGRVVVD